MPRVLTAMVIVMAMACVLTSCDDVMISVYGYSRLTSADGVEGVGTIVYISISGGFYGIIAGKDGHWEPVNLPAAFMQDGLKVRFEAKLRKDLAGNRQWGLMVELTSISKI